MQRIDSAAAETLPLDSPVADETRMQRLDSAAAETRPLESDSGAADATETRMPRLQVAPAADSVPDNACTPMLDSVADVA